MSFLVRNIFLVALLFGCAGIAAAQGIGADGRPFFPRNPDDERPMGIKEGVEKMRIAKEKKDHDEMVARGEEAVKIAGEVQRSFVATGSLTSEDLAKVGKVEKLVKKIREELGGDEDERRTELTESLEDEQTMPNTTNGAVDALKVKTDSLYDQLKQTTRFTISAAAIVSSNAVLRIARFLKLKK